MAVNFKQHIPNFVTIARIVGSILLLFIDASTTITSPFWMVYLFCGLTDMADGFLARRLHAESKTGAMLDSVADLCFWGCCAWKVFPLLHLDWWMWVWITLIILIKVINQISALVIYHKCKFPHTIANKVTGLLLFLSIPFFLCYTWSIPIILTTFCATFSAIQEGHFIRKKLNIC